jgi:hypothetical protein
MWALSLAPMFGWSMPSIMGWLKVKSELQMRLCLRDLRNYMLIIKLDEIGSKN